MFGLSRNGRSAYIKRVKKWVESELKVFSSETGTEVRVVEVSGAQSDWKLFIHVDEVNPIEDWRDFEQQFSAMAERANERFNGEHWYFGIEIRVPLRLLGKLGAKARLEQTEQEYTNVTCRRVRLAEED